MTQRTASAGTGLPIRQPRTIGPGSPLHRLTDPGWGIEIHATVNGAGFVKWGDFYYGRGPCHAFFPYKVGHLGWILGDFLRTWSLQTRYITWGTDPDAPSPHAPEQYQSSLATSDAPRSTGQQARSTKSPGGTTHHPPGMHVLPHGPPSIQTLAVNWSVSQVAQIARGTSPGYACTPPITPDRPSSHNRHRPPARSTGQPL